MQRSATNEDTFRLVYDHVYPIIFRIAYRITDSVDVAEELCQEAFIKYYERVDMFPDRDQAKYWLIRVIKNLSLNVAKRVNRERKAYERAYHEPQRSSRTGEDKVIRDEEQHEVQAALQRLPEKLKSVLVLKEYGDLNYKEIASILSITEGNVKVRVFRARERLMAILNEDNAGDITPSEITESDKDANAT
jgi:RNA polymerase sigma-70 factor, ECF subfamily